MAKSALEIYHFGAKDPLTQLLKAREEQPLELDLRSRAEAVEEQGVEGQPRRTPCRQLKYLRFHLDLLGASTVLEEPQYFDRDYLSEFSAFYSTSVRSYGNLIWVPPSVHSEDSALTGYVDTNPSSLPTWLEPGEGGVPCEG